MVILITGDTHTGKTLLAQRLLEKYKLSGIFLMVKRVLNLLTLKRNPNFQMQSSGLLSVGCLRKTNFPTLQKK